MGFLEDLRYAMRGLARYPGVAVAAVFSLALGIGANTTIFTMVNAILLRPMPVANPTTLAAVSTTDLHNPGLLLCSYPNYKDYRDRNQVFSSLIVHTVVGMNLTGSGVPRMVFGELVSANYFSTLGVAPIIGRGFRPEEDATPGAFPVAVISYGLWRQQFAADPQITSRTIQLNGRAYDIVGVAPPGFQGLYQLYAADIWAPMAMYQQLHPMAAQVPLRRFLGFAVAGRLKPGVSLAQAEAGMRSIAQDLERQYPTDNRGRTVRLSALAEATMAAKTRTMVSQSGVVLLIVSSLVLLIACANVANLLLARAAARSKEISVRLAIGAGRWRLVRQLLTESLVLALVGGGAGLLLARWARDLVWAVRPPIFKYAGFRLDLDTRVLFYSLAVSFATGILFGIIPALRGTRSDLATDLKERTGQPASRGGLWRARPALVVCQVSLSMVALAGAALFLRSIANATRIDTGFDSSHLAAITFNVSEQGYNEARGREYQSRVLEMASATPGVASAALAKDPPLHVSGARTVRLQGQENTVSGGGRFTLTTAVTPGFFQTAGIPLLQGRDFSTLDRADSPHVAIVNEAAAARFWPGAEAVGQSLNFVGDNKPAEVIAVARNANYQSVGEEPQAFIYLALQQYYFPTAVLYVRSAGDPESAAVAVRRQIQPLDRNLVLDVESVESTIRESLWAQRLLASLLAVFGLLALLLASIGIYGVISYSVHQRFREFGVRMALGATPSGLQFMVVREGMRLVAIGIAAGTAIALLAWRAVQGMLFLSGAGDFSALLAVPALLGLIGTLACWAPARRATHIQPSTALRDE